MGSTRANGIVAAIRATTNTATCVCATLEYYLSAFVGLLFVIDPEPEFNLMYREGEMAGFGWKLAVCSPCGTRVMIAKFVAYSRGN